jgi:hypothetical protein
MEPPEMGQDTDPLSAMRSSSANYGMNQGMGGS